MGTLPGWTGSIALALEKADRLKVIARYGVGVDNVDLEAAQEKKASWSPIHPGANSVSVAELALGLMLALARQIPEALQGGAPGQIAAPERNFTGRKDRRDLRSGRDRQAAGPPAGRF